MIEKTNGPTYEGKYFYEIVKGTSQGELDVLKDLTDTVFYTVSHDGQNGSNEFPYIEITDGIPQRLLKKEQMLVLSVKLNLTGENENG